MELIHCAFLHNSESNAKSHGNISSRWTPLLHAKVLKKTQPLSHHFIYVHMAECNRAVPGCCQELNTASRHQRSGLPQSGNGNRPHGKARVLPLSPTGDEKPRSELKSGKPEPGPGSLGAASREHCLRSVLRLPHQYLGKAVDEGQA